MEERMLSDAEIKCYAGQNSFAETDRGFEVMDGRTRTGAAHEFALDPARLLEDQIGRVIRERTGGRISNLGVSFSNDHVTIEGRTNSYYNKQLATHAALSLLAYASLSNDIRVSK